MVLAALVLVLEGEGLPEPLGLRGFFYGLLREVAPEVHDQGENPFALGFGGREGASWARVSLLVEELYARLAPRLYALEGEVLSQRPSAGDSVPVGSEVNVVLSSQQLEYLPLPGGQ